MGKRSFKNRYEDFLFDHIWLKRILEYGFSLLVVVLSAFIFTIGYKCFLAPAALISSGSSKIVSGGASGISQVIVLFIELFPGNFITENNIEDLMFSICYFSLNIPVFVLAWIGIGKRFTVFTFINVLCSSLFTTLFNRMEASGYGEWITAISTFVNDNGGMLSRAIFAGVCTGLSSAFAYKVDASAGGIDVVAYYIALKKSTLVGKYSTIINVCIVAVFTGLTCAKIPFGNAIGGALFSVVYMIMTMLVVNLIHRRNKKVEIRVVTAIPDLSEILIANLPHAATVTKGYGAFSHSEKTIISIVVSSYEAKNAIKVIRKADPNSFVEVYELAQVYGRFFIRPVE